MTIKNTSGKQGSGAKRRAVSIVAAAALALGMIPLSGCSWQDVSQALSMIEKVVETAQVATGETPAQVADGQGGPLFGTTFTGGAAASDAEGIDTSSWQTLGDAFATGATSTSYVYNDDYIICVFQVGDSYIRAVAKMDPQIDEELTALDFMADDHDQQVLDVLSRLELVEAQDLTPQAISQDELDQLVGKTGKDLVDEGFVFSYYYTTGETDAGAMMQNGAFNYAVTFDAVVADPDADEDGTAIMDATVTDAQVAGVSDDLMDISALE